MISLIKIEKAVTTRKISSSTDRNEAFLPLPEIRFCVDNPAELSLLSLYFFSRLIRFF
ncbi:unnamed protein product [Brassica napus]|uniref:(rape) hypothetical protein n=1 Tax=Brassica napus TaxID=3708 RepID=A0A816XYI4_BRANA|nr:unnamed protein product [Brassica napus]